MDRKEEVDKLKKRLGEPGIKTTSKKEPRKVGIAVIPEGPKAIDDLKATLESSAKRLVETQAAWEEARKQSEPVCCFCHKAKKNTHALIQGYAPDRRPIFICSDCVIYSMRILQGRKVKVGPTF